MKEFGLSQAKIKEISHIKNEPKWMLDFRLKSYKEFSLKFFCMTILSLSSNSSSEVNSSIFPTFLVLLFKYKFTKWFS